MTRIDINPDEARQAAHTLSQLATTLDGQGRILSGLALPAMPPSMFPVAGDLQAAGRTLRTSVCSDLGEVTEALRRKADEAQALDAKDRYSNVKEHIKFPMDVFELLSPGQLGHFKLGEKGTLWLAKDWVAKSIDARTARVQLKADRRFGTWSKWVTECAETRKANAALVTSVGGEGDAWLGQLSEDGGWLGRITQEGSLVFNLLTRVGSRLGPAGEVLVGAAPRVAAVGRFAGRWLGPIGLGLTFVSGVHDAIDGGQSEHYTGWRSTATRIFGGLGALGAGVLLVGMFTPLGPVVLAVAAVAVVAYAAWQLGNFAYDHRQEIGQFGNWLSGQSSRVSHAF